MSAQVIPQNRIARVESYVHIIECWDCAVDFGIGDGFRENRLKDGRVFYCPNGHGNYYNKGKTADQAKADRLEQQLEAARSLARRESQRARTADYKARAAKGQLTKARKRMAAGVCPCCNRTFSNVVAHMAGQHPDFLEQVRGGAQ